MFSSTNEPKLTLFDRSYADKDLKERHRPHKKQFHATAESTDKIQHCSHNLAKAREARTRLENSSSSGPKEKVDFFRSFNSGPFTLQNSQI